jgi:hypothetical protein
MWILNAFIVVCAILMLINWLALVSAMRSRRNYSFAPPLLLGIAAAIAVLLHPVHEMRSFAWIPLIVDPSIGLPISCIFWRHLKNIKSANKR